MEGSHVVDAAVAASLPLHDMLPQPGLDGGDSVGVALLPLLPFHKILRRFSPLLHAAENIDDDVC